MKRWRVITGLGCIVVLGIIGWRVSQKAEPSEVSRASSPQLPQVSTNQAQDINAACSSIGSDGFGHYSLHGVTSIKQAQVKIIHPCKLQLASGASLNIDHSQLITKNLVIYDDSKGLRPAQLSISDSSLSGQESGLQVSFDYPGGQVTISHSQFNYGLSIGVAVGKSDTDTRASLTVANSEFASSRGDSEGIYLVTTGTGIFKHNNFRGVNGQTALLLAPACSLVDNVGANQRCQSK